jgi:hypothetical protein
MKDRCILMIGLIKEHALALIKYDRSVTEWMFTA